MGRALAANGTVLLLRTRGRVTGRVAEAAVGFVEEPDGSLLVAAAASTADWARNLLAQPRCRALRAGSEQGLVAEPLSDEAFRTAIRELILKYGAPAERLGRGPAFRLRPERH